MRLREFIMLTRAQQIVESTQHVGVDEGIFDEPDEPTGYNFVDTGVWIDDQGQIASFGTVYTLGFSLKEFETLVLSLR